MPNNVITPAITFARSIGAAGIPLKDDQNDRFTGAVVRAPLDPAILDTEIAVATVRNCHDDKCKPHNIRLGTLFSAICSHVEGDKDGPGLIFADMNAGSRVKNGAKAQTALAYDFDRGTPIAEVRAAVSKTGFSAALFSTHSHGKTRTEISRDKLIKYAAGRPIEEDALIQAYLRDECHYHQSIHQTAKYAGTEHTAKGIVVFADHDPMDKLRVVFPLAEPFVHLNEGTTLQDAHQKWEKLYNAVGEKLGFDFDTSCSDPARLFYIGRHDAEQPFVVELFGGPLFDWRSIEIETLADKLSAELDRGKSKSVTPGGRALGRWARDYAATFQIADAYEAYAPDKIKGRTAIGIEIECPFSENHSNPNDPEDRACLAVNAGYGPSDFAAVTCHHHSCKDKTMLDMIAKAIEDDTLPESVLTDPDFYGEIVDGEAQPVETDDQRIEREVKEAIQTLRRDAPHTEIGTLLNKIARLSDRVAADDLAGGVARATDRPVRVLREQITQERRKQKAEKKRKPYPVATAPGKRPVDPVIGAVENHIPLPSASYGDFAYRSFEGRVWLHRIECDKGDPEYIRLHTAMRIESGLIYPDRKDTRGLRVGLLDENGVVQRLDLEAGLVVQGNGTALKTRLREASVAWTNEGEAFIAAQFKQISPRDPISVYDRPGWHGSAFLTPWGTAINSNEPIELAAESRPSGAESGGTLEGALDAVRAASETGILHFQLAPMMAFASPIIDLLQYPSMVIDLTGYSSQGKSTTQELAASMYGDPAPKQGQVQTFNATTKSAEALLQRASGNYAAFDEVKLADDRDVQQFIFMVSSDSGADRLDRNANLKLTRGWKLLVVISDEASLAERIKRSGKTATTGVSTRALDINVDGTESLSVEVMDRINAYKTNFGHTAPLFIRQLAAMGYVTDRERLDAEIGELITELVGSDAPAQKRRAARIVAVLWKAGMIAQEAGIIPSDADLADIAMRTWERALASEIAPAQAEDRAIRTLFENLLMRRGADITDGSDKQYRASVAWRLEAFKEHGAVYVVPYAKLRELAGGALEAKTLSRTLAERELIILPNRRDKKSNCWDHVPTIGAVRSLIIPAKFVENEVAPPAEPDKGSDVERDE
jgi:hypothetical protein